MKRERADNSVPDNEKVRDCSGPDAVVKTEDVGVPCTVEPTEAAGALHAHRGCLGVLLYFRVDVHGKETIMR